MRTRNPSPRQPPRRPQPLSLSIQGAHRFRGLPARSTLMRWVRGALDRRADLTLRFVGTREGRRLNREFRGRDHATNVLTFEHQRAPAVWADVVICVPVLVGEARAQGKSLRNHIAHLVVHGVLHAQGWDHRSQGDAGRMETREIEVLSHFGIPNPYE